MSELDLLDKKIMYELDLNARISARQLAKKLKKSKETVNFRINRLINNGFIKRFYTVFNTSKLGWYYIKVYVKFKNITPEKEIELFNYLQNQPHMAYLASIEGYYDCIFLIMVRNAQDMINMLNPFMKLYGEFIQQKDICTFLRAHRLTARYLFPGKEKKDLTYPIILEDYKLDYIDKKISYILSNQARMPLIEIAKKINVDHKIVKYRIKKLEKDNIILSYVTGPNFDKLGLQFIQLNIFLKDPTIKNSIIEYFDSTNKCDFAAELLGKYDLTIELHIKDSEELKKIIDDFRVKFVNQYNDYDVSTVTKEYIMLWNPFSEEKEKKIKFTSS